MQTETFTADAATFRATLNAARAVLLPTRGLIKRYIGIDYDDYGVERQVIISSTGFTDEDGSVTWSEAVR